MALFFFFFDQLLGASSFISVFVVKEFCRISGCKFFYTRQKIQSALKAVNIDVKESVALYSLIYHVFLNALFFLLGCEILMN